MDGFIIFYQTVGIFGKPSWFTYTFLREKFPNMTIEEFHNMVLSNFKSQKSKPGVTGCYLSKIEPLTDSEVESTLSFLATSPE